MEDIYCPKCREPIGFPYMKCPGCHWFAMGKDLEAAKERAECFIKEDIENEEQDRFVMDQVLEEVNERGEKESKRKITEYRSLSKYTFRRYMTFNIIFVILPYVLTFFIMFASDGDGGDILVFILEEPILFVLGCAGISAFLIGVNSFLYFFARIKLLFMDMKN